MGTRTSARDRLLAAANELFYEEGIHTVGIDRVIERAGVAKASLYSTFGSKDALVRAYLASRQEAEQRRVTDALGHGATPRERLLAVFDRLAELAAEPDFRGCAFTRASAESAGESCVREVSDASRSWLRSVFVEIARSAAVADPEHLGRQLVLLYDGATVVAQLDRDPRAAADARDIAAMVFDAAVRSS